MDIFRVNIKASVALLIAGSAILLFSCKNPAEENGQDDARLMTQQSENLTITYTKEGKVTYVAKTPLLERYEFAKPEPYSEFRKGVYLEMYNDTTGIVETTITANYALWLEVQDLWEGKGNVIVTNYKGERLETEQLFYNRKTKRIWSNVDSRISQGTDVSYGTGFESDDRMEEWEFRQPDWSIEVDNSQMPGQSRRDSVGAGGGAAGVEDAGASAGGNAAQGAEGA